MKFSQRIGKTNINEIIQVETINKDLRNRLCTVFSLLIILNK